MECTLYDEQCFELIEEFTLTYQFEFETLMHGNEDLLYEDNCGVFDAVQKYLEVTKCFS